MKRFSFFAWFEDWHFFRRRLKANITNSVWAVFSQKVRQANILYFCSLGMYFFGTRKSVKKGLKMLVKLTTDNSFTRLPKFFCQPSCQNQIKTLFCVLLLLWLFFVFTTYLKKDLQTGLTFRFRAREQNGVNYRFLDCKNMQLS